MECHYPLLLIVDGDGNRTKYYQERGRGLFPSKIYIDKGDHEEKHWSS